jgi:hypothetical protein
MSWLVSGLSGSSGHPRAASTTAVRWACATSWRGIALIERPFVLASSLANDWEHNCEGATSVVGPPPLPNWRGTKGDSGGIPALLASSQRWLAAAMEHFARRSPLAIILLCKACLS